MKNLYEANNVFVFNNAYFIFSSVNFLDQNKIILRSFPFINVVHIITVESKNYNFVFRVMKELTKENCHTLKVEKSEVMWLQYFFACDLDDYQNTSI